MKQHTKTSWLILAMCPLLLLQFSCNEVSNRVNQGQNNVQLDSIVQWIDDAKNTEFTFERRNGQVQRAYHTLKGFANDSVKTQQLSQVSLAFLKLPDSMMFRKANREAIALGLQIGDSITVAESHWDMGTFFRNRAIADSAYHHFGEAQKIYQAQRNQYFSGRMWYNMALVQSHVKDYTSSEINLIKAIELLKPLNKTTQLFHCYNLLGTVSKNLKEYDRALGYFNTALEYLNQLEHNQDYEIQVLNNIGVVYQELESYLRAITYFKQVLNTKNLIEKDAELYAISLNNLSYNQLKLGINEHIEGQLNQALSVGDSIGNVQRVSESHYILAEYYLSSKDTIKALHSALEAQKYAKQSTHNKYLLMSLQLLARLEPNEALAHTEKYITLNDSLLQEERQARNKFTRIRFETDEFIAENEELTRKKQIWTGIAIAILLLGLAAYTIVSQRAKNQKLKFQQKQQSSNQEIFNLMLSQKQKLAEGKQMEQKRISEELHDGVLGKMLGARMVLTGLNRKTGDEAERERSIAISVLKDIEGEVRSISHELSHAAYQDIHNFISSIQELLKDICTPNNLTYNFEYDDQLDWDGLGGDIKINLYRMVQESLQNSVKHAECKNILINFVSDSGYLNVLIEDDGKGFKSSKKKKGIGTRNINSRIEKLNGTWKIESTPNKGTKVFLMIPISYYADEEPIDEENKLVES